MDNAQLINQDSGDYEYYSPLNIVEKARQTMGSIDLDPASSYKANLGIKAKNYFTQYNSGLDKDWCGNIWMNHPFSKENNKIFINKIYLEFCKGNVENACVLTFAATSEKWFQILLLFPQCFLHPRTDYLTPEGVVKPGVTKGSVVTFLSKHDSNYFKFKYIFRDLGVVK